VVAFGVLLASGGGWSHELPEGAASTCPLQISSAMVPSTSTVVATGWIRFFLVVEARRSREFILVVVGGEIFHMEEAVLTPGDSSRWRPCLRFRAISEASGFVIFGSRLSAAPSGIIPDNVEDSWLSGARVW
jgi:hypothetical protein